MIAIVDYGMGNVRSLRNALEYLGEDVTVTDDAAELDAADRIVLPGVGAFGDAMVAIRERGLEALRRMLLKVSVRLYTGTENELSPFIPCWQQRRCCKA